MKPNHRIAAAVFVSIPLVILSSAVSCTLAISRGASMQWRLLFRALCHGMPERCFALWGVPMPICARCTAIYVGLAAGLAAYFLVPWLQERTLRIALFVAATPLAIDGLTQLTGLRESTNVLRAATGLLAGFVFGIWALAAVTQHSTTEFPTS